MSEQFGIESHDATDKSFELYTPFEGVRIDFDYDDVDHDAADLIAAEMVRVLNEHFPTKAVARAISGSRDHPTHDPDEE